MNLLLMTVLLLGNPAVEARQPPDRDPSTMTRTEIAAFNQGLERKHPQFISCQKTDVIGSIVKKLRVCRTNAEWARADFTGNDNARDTVEAMQRAPRSGN